MIRTLLIIASTVFVPVSALAAQDLTAAYRAALDHDPRFLAARYEYESTREAIPQAYAGLMPALSLTARQGRQDQQIFNRDNPFFGIGRSRFNSSSFSFELSQPVFRFESWVRLKQSKAIVRQAFAVLAAAEQDLILRTAEAYLNVLAGLDNLGFAEAEKTAVNRQLTVVEARRRGGLATVTDVFEAKARSAQVEANVIAAQYALDDAYEALREVVGDAVTGVMTLKDDIPLIPPEPLNVELWVDRSLAQNFELIARHEAVIVAGDEIRRRRAAHLPSLDLVVRHGNAETGGAVTGGGSDVDTTDVSLQVSVPIFSGGVVRSRTRSAQKDFRRAQEERKLQHLIVMRNARGAFQGVSAAINLARALEESLLAQESVLDGKSKGYQSGVNTLLDVLDAESDLTSTRRDYARARYEYLLNLLRLKAGAGQLGESDIVYLNSLLERGAT